MLDGRRGEGAIAGGAGRLGRNLGDLAVNMGIRVYSMAELCYAVLCSILMAAQIFCRWLIEMSVFRVCWNNGLKWAV